MKNHLLIVLSFLLIFAHSVFGQTEIESLIKKSNEFENEGKYTEAIVEINKAIRIQPQNSNLYLRRAGFFEQLRDYGSFSNDLLKMVELAPNDLESYLTATHLLLRHQICKEALTVANDGVMRFPSEAKVFGDRSRVKTCLDDFEGAMTDIKKALSLDPLSELYKHNQANILRLMSKKSESIESYTEQITRLELKFSISEDPDFRLKNDLSSAYRGRAFIFERNNELEKAFADLSRSIEVDQSSHSYNYRARVFIRQKMYNKALEDLNQAIKLDPENSFIYLIDRGTTYQYMEKHEEALKDFESVLQSGKIRSVEFIEKRIEQIKKKIQQKHTPSNQK